MTLTLTEYTWNKIYNQIREEYGDTTVLLTGRLKDTLGFTVRRHRDYNPINGHMINDIRLDFYNDAALTFFQLKYL